MFLNSKSVILRNWLHSNSFACDKDILGNRVYLPFSQPYFRQKNWSCLFTHKTVRTGLNSFLKLDNKFSIIVNLFVKKKGMHVQVYEKLQKIGDLLAKGYYICC